MASIEAREVPRVHTPLSVEQLGELLITAHRKLYGVPPSPERLLTAWAQVSLETSRGKQCYGNNLGNIVVSIEWPGANYTYRVHERVKRDPDVWREQLQRFRAYDTPLDGAMDYWRVITMNFGRHLPRFDGGEPREAGTGLCNSGYSTSDCAAYGQSMAALYTTLFAMFHHRLRELRGQTPAAMTWPLWEELERRTGIRYCALLSSARLQGFSQAYCAKNPRSRRSADRETPAPRPQDPARPSPPASTPPTRRASRCSQGHAHDASGALDDQIALCSAEVRPANQLERAQSDHERSG